MTKTISINGEHALVADDIIVFDPNGPLKNYKDSLSGSFTWPSGQVPGSILVNKGKTICGTACHQWIGYPETVLYRYKNGAIGIGKFKSDLDIPNRAEVLWAVGGCGMLAQYKPSAEGFCKGTRPDGTPFNYTDVLRQTSHSVLALKQGKLYGIYFHSKSAYQINLWLKVNGFELAIMLDGGHITAINGTGAQHNLTTPQGYAIQFIDNIMVKRPLVAWDAGHNKLNPSNQSPDGTYKEWEGNIDVVQRAMPHLTRCGVDSIFIDVLNANQGEELTELVRKINLTHADICVSRHDNAAANTEARGMEVFCYKMQGESLRLAQCVHKEMLALGQKDRGIKDGSSLYVVRETSMPCVLVESAFHTSPPDLLLLKDPAYREREAVCLAKGIVAYFGLRWIA